MGVGAGLYMYDVVVKRSSRSLSHLLTLVKECFRDFLNSVFFLADANPSYKLACTPRYDNIARTRNVSECSVLTLRLV